MAADQGTEHQEHNDVDQDQLRGRPYTMPESLQRCYDWASEAFGWRPNQRLLAHGPKRRGIEDTSEGLTLGTPTTLAEIETHPVIKQRYPLLA